MKPIKYRIISNGEKYQVQRLHKRWFDLSERWRSCRYSFCYGVMEFKSLIEAESGMKEIAKNDKMRERKYEQIGGIFETD